MKTEEKLDKIVEMLKEQARVNEFIEKRINDIESRLDNLNDWIAGKGD